MTLPEYIATLRGALEVSLFRFKELGYLYGDDDYGKRIKEHNIPLIEKALSLPVPDMSTESQAIKAIIKWSEAKREFDASFNWVGKDANMKPDLYETSLRKQKSEAELHRIAEQHKEDGK